MGNAIKLIITGICSIIMFKLMINFDTFMMQFIKDSDIRFAVDLVATVTIALLICYFVEKYVDFD